MGLGVGEEFNSERFVPIVVRERRSHNICRFHFLLSSGFGEAAPKIRISMACVSRPKQSQRENPRSIKTEAGGCAYFAPGLRIDFPHLGGPRSKLSQMVKIESNTSKSLHEEEGVSPYMVLILGEDLCRGAMMKGRDMCRGNRYQ